MKPSSRRADAQASRNAHLRQLIASTAARLMAEDGIADYPLAKRKAARQLGSPDTDALPTNAEVESELRAYQALYQEREQKERIDELRGKAAEMMEIMTPFHPYLTGSVLDGSAGRYAEVDILLYPDSAKEVEIFLLNRQIPFEHTTPRHDRVDAVLQLDMEGDTINLVIYPPQDERTAYRSRDGRLRERARLEAVRALLPANP
ncbi:MULTISPECIES: hypothetical protein [Azospira]|uniref:Nucleotidyltransferase n=1 Tax=Azospira oryzae TaxID=146939 RepID=A0ABY0IRV2_9RHOO|nr:MULTISPECIES: hypothetical protein [Azospira]MBP7488465.1 hypothetical protein [Azospira sp.]MDK9691906.1 hypothetical protein [Azospira sp.]RZT76861.1 hypothetical protein EV678_2745 [Azospira oryzae]TLS19837.1 MAG: hypothetical protein FDZ72_02125 [Betaproteobacteria bacterium]